MQGSLGMNIVGLSSRADPAEEQQGKGTREPQNSLRRDRTLAHTLL